MTYFQSADHRLPEPPWRRYDGECLSPDAEPSRLDAEELAEYEAVRKAYGIAV
jgi:hypothetical protein